MARRPRDQSRLLAAVKRLGLMGAAVSLVLWIAGCWWCVEIPGFARRFEFAVQSGRASVIWFPDPRTSSLLTRWRFYGHPFEMFPSFQWYSSRIIRYVYLPLWAPTAALGVIGGGAWWLERCARRGGVKFCPRCGYDRAGLAAGALCPECGTGSTVVDA